MHDSAPLISIVTPVLNRVRFIGDSIRSLAAQEYPNVEHIVMDGGSTDGTLDVLRQYEDRLRWESIPGLAQAPAINRALAMSQGEIIGILNSDDLYLPGALRRAAEIFAARPNLDAFYGTCLLIDVDGRTIGTHSTKAFNVNRLIWWEPGYFTIQAMFFRRRVFDLIGGWDTSLPLTTDYDWFIRVGKKCQVEYVPECLGAFRRHEDATQGRRHREACFHEVVRTSRRHGGYWFTPIKYQFMERVPAATTVTRWLVPVKRVLVRAGLAPAWL